MKVRYAAAGVALSLAGLGLTGCGDSAPSSEATKPEKIDVQQSAAWLESAAAVRTTLGLSGDVAALKKLAEAKGEKVSKEDEAAMELLTSAKIVVVSSAKAQNDPSALSSVAVQVGGQDLVSAVLSQKDAYLKIDPEQLPASLDAQVKKSGGDVTQIAGMIDMFAPGAGDVLRNKWVHIDLAAVYELAGQPEPTPDAAAQAKAQKVLEDLLAKVTVVDGSADGHKVATVKGEDLKVAVGELVSIGSDVAGEGASPEQLKDLKKELDEAELPAETKVDLYLDGDKLVKVGVDLMQFDKENTTAGQPLNLEIGFEEAQPVTAPADAKDVDLSKALENLKGMMGGSLNG